ncbi:cell division topological specificity factor MinE [Stella sp.]|uniref:cell division topological specificity factor MinE n=1 Tax=Stella sp. TaxID=2912054 RepID=UPI0035B223B7
MGLFDFFRKKAPPPAVVPSAPAAATVAKERLQILLSHERADRGDRAEFLPALQREILEVVAKYLVIDQEKVMVKLERGKDISFLEVNVELPGPDVKLLRTPKPTETAADKPAETAGEKTAETPADKPADKPAEAKVEKPAEKAADKVAAEKIGDGKPLAGGPGLATA